MLRWDGDEKQVYYGKRKFIPYGDGIFWWMVIRDDVVLLRNCQTRKFLKISKDGSLTMVGNEAEASSWELIHIF